ncbi:DUF6397 family protein [Streptomyces sp. NPDC058861]|uniref:DUF6397 family protein n=1 Tax=Streptomyces sp. NPDC058861 TaxID=3346653 RepID=UPI0036CCFE16
MTMADGRERAAGEAARTVTPARAARELELERDEFRLAVQLGLVRTVAAGEGGRRKVERGELDRLKAAPDFPAGLRDRVRAVGTGEAAALLGITPERFTRLARTGHLSPVRFSLNRYRAVVWTYVAEEVADFGRACPALLAGRLPSELRERLAAGEDLRPRNWRARRLALLLRGTDDPWARASAVASLLDPLQVAEVVDDPYERAHLDRLRPPPPTGMPVSAAARELAERLTRADDPDEILWHRLSLALALDEARAACPAPYPGETATTAPIVPTARGIDTEPAARSGPASSMRSGPPSSVRPGAVPSVRSGRMPSVRPGAADPWAVPVVLRGGPRALSARPRSLPTAPPFPTARPFLAARPFPTAPVPALAPASAPAPASVLASASSTTTAPALAPGATSAPSPAPSAVPPPSAATPAPSVTTRRAARPDRTRFLDRFRRGRAGGEAHPRRRRRRPVTWP